MASKTYYCPVEVTIDVIGGKWKCTILWWLRRGPKRFGELRHLIPEISQKVLTTQLRELEADGLISRQAFRESPPRVEYSLTDYGETVRPLTEAMCEWGKSHLPDYSFGFRKLKDLQVLIAVDDVELRDRLQQGLAICGAEMTAVATAIARDASALPQADVVVIDLDPSNADSARLCQQVSALILRREWPGVAIALTTREAFDPALIQGFQVRLTKPIEMAELVAALAVPTEREALPEDQ